MSFATLEYSCKRTVVCLKIEKVCVYTYISPQMQKMWHKVASTEYFLIEKCVSPDIAYIVIH